MAFTYGNSWQNRPDEGEGKAYPRKKPSKPFKPFIPKVRQADPEKEYCISFWIDGEEIESFFWTLDEWEQEQIDLFSQFSLNGCEYYWAEDIAVDHAAKTITVNCS
jgi:hypothetical protein